MQHSAANSVEVILDAGRDMRPGEAQRLRFLVREASSGRAVGDIVDAHERPAHLIVVRSDLEHFQHLHPTLQETGAYAAEVVLPEAGSYLLFPEFQRANGEHIVGRIEIHVGEPGQLPKPRLVPQRDPVQAEGEAVTLTQPARIRTGEDSRFMIHITRADTGEDERLRPYLAAAAHVVILDEGAERFAHAHGSVPGDTDSSSHAGHVVSHVDHTAEGLIGPDVIFSHVFPAPGLYRMWAQYLPVDSGVKTVSFDIRVE